MEARRFTKRRSSSNRSRISRNCCFEKTDSRVGNGERNPKKGGVDLRARKLKRDAFIDREKRNYPFRLLCQVMKVSASGYYARRKRLSKLPRLKTRKSADLVRNCYFENRKRYGARRISKALSKRDNCYDNAQAESFFSRFKTELIENGVFEDLEQALSEIFSYIEGYYNRVRLHSSLDDKSALEFEMELKSKNERGKRQFFV